MDNPRIQHFTSSFVAFFRPIKRTYYILEWNQEFQFWGRYNEEHTGITLHKSILHETSFAELHVQKGRTQFSLLTIQGSGFFLQVGERNIPILDKITGNIPNGCIAREYTVDQTIPYTEESPYLKEVILWSIQPFPIVLNLPIIEIHDSLPIPEAIPRRIARLVVEDAIKKNELCGIIMEPLEISNTAVTSCYHTFNAVALETWFEKNATRSTCPACRKICSMAKC